MRRPQIKKARDRAKDLILRYHITRPAIPVEVIAKELGLTVRYSNLDAEISGMIYMQNGSTIVGINSSHHPNRQRFTLAHECGHFLLHREHIIGAVHVDKRYPALLRSDISSQGVDAMEIEANQFAAELLVPEDLLIKEIALIENDVEDDNFVSVLTKKFKVSSNMMSNCLANIRVH